MTLVFAFTLCLGAALLFSLQPMIGKMLLPLFGGSAQVWIVCMLFFQGLLLAGYAWSEFLARRKSLVVQTLLQFVLLACAALIFQPSFIDSSAHNEAWTDSPILSLLALLAGSTAPAFFSLATLAPLLQYWYSRSGSSRASNPYFLYAASNLGSLLGLLLYPFLIETQLDLPGQLAAWNQGFKFLLVLVLADSLWILTRRAKDTPAESNAAAGASQSISLNKQGLWFLLAALPSSLSLGLTNFISSEIAPFPLLWIIPLGLYLLSFILAFAPVPLRAPVTSYRFICLLASALVLAAVLETIKPVGLIVSLNLLTFFLAAWICHSQLALSAPPSSYLPRFYLCVAAGGFAGGIFNACLAPLIFSTHLEYPLVLALSTICAPRPGTKFNMNTRSLFLWALCIFAPAAGAIWFASISGLETNAAVLVATFAVPLLINYSRMNNAVLFGSGLFVLALAGSLYQGVSGRALEITRNFFGVLRITTDRDEKFYRMIHGRTLHGSQARAKQQGCEAQSYYSASGPAGKILTTHGPAGMVGVIGLGAGSLACYAKSQARWKFFEINPEVVRVARDSPYFSFLRNSSAAGIEVALGDGRLNLAREPDHGYDILVLDAFSSDSIPVHLLTSEAFNLYLKKLKPGGILLIHISNLHLNLRPVVAALAAGADINARIYNDGSISPAQEAEGKFASDWVLVFRRGAVIESNLDGWQDLAIDSEKIVWTDAYSNVLSIIRW